MDTSHLEDLISERTLCVVATHMFGFPCDIYRICEIADSAGAWVVEDAAQSAGAKYEGYRVGTFGAASLFSLGMGKNFTTGNGGIICVNSPEIEEIIADSVNKLAEPGLVKAFTSLTTLIVYWLLVRPGTFGLVLLLWNHDDDNNDNFPVTRLSGPQSTVGSELLAELDNLNSLRTSNGAFIASALEEVTTIHIPKPIHGTDSVYLRLPMLFQDEETRDATWMALRRQSILAAKSYQALTGLTNADYVKRTILTLPTHPYVRSHDIETMISTITTLNRPELLEDSKL